MQNPPDMRVKRILLTDLVQWHVSLFGSFRLVYGQRHAVLSVVRGIHMSPVDASMLQLVCSIDYVAVVKRISRISNDDLGPCCYCATPQGLRT